MKRFKEFFIVVLPLLAACSGSGTLSNQNLAYLYQSEEAETPDYFFHHITDTLSEFWFRIPSAGLQYTSPTEKQPAMTNARLSIRLFLPEYPSVIKDTATIILRTPNRGTDGYITGSFEVRTNAPELMAEINLWDLNKGAGKKALLATSRRNPGQREYYLLKDTAGNVLFTHYFNESTKRIIISKSNGPIGTIQNGFHLNEFPFPPPPFSQQDFTSFPFRAQKSVSRTITDSAFVLEIDREGFYHIRNDTSRVEGLTIFQMGSDFPGVTTQEQLLNPLRYITSAREFLEMKNASNVKFAVDKFWLKAGGSPDRARLLISKFYNRVARSNELFSSYTEGWKTDRGMLYIIFGPPNIVHRTASGETWVYGEEKSMLSMKFSFVKLRNPFTPEDYTLTRSETYRNHWYRAVESWREGRAL